MASRRTARLSIPEKLGRAVGLRRIGKFSEAEALYRQILAEDPCRAEAHAGMGDILRDRGEFGPAIESYRRALEIKPAWIEVVGNLGNTLQQDAQIDAAVASFRRLLELRPNLAEAHYNLGNALLAAGQIDQAIAAYRDALKLKPQLAMAHSNLGNVLRDKGQFDAAIASYQRALQLDSGLAEAHNNLGNVLRRTGQPDAAISSYRKAIGIRPEFADAHANLGHALKEKGLLEEAIAAVRTASRLKPDQPDYRYALAAWTGDQSTVSAPAGYVAKLFDEYAPQFDEHLVGKLDYQAPAQLFAAVTALAPGRRFDILDLGCGTGLCGLQFRPLVRSLTGVDLARNMVDKAAERGIYDRLITGELLEAMDECAPGTFDLLLAADVFIYVGEVSGVFRAACRVLREGGFFAFSVERHEGDGVRLQPSARFAHSLRYLQGLARQYAFSWYPVQEVTLRKEYGTDIPGLIVVLGKTLPASPA